VDAGIAVKSEIDAEVRSYCRLCFNGCAIKVGVTDGRVVEVTGDRADPLYHGYTCVKGRLQPELLRDGSRLRHSLRRARDGAFNRVAVADAIAEIAVRLRELSERYGPNSVAFYRGTMSSNSSTSAALFEAFVDAFGSSMRFSPNTIDKPGKMIAQAMHGRWRAPVAGYSDPEIAMLVGINPPVSYQGAPRGNPTNWLSSHVKSGGELIVIDPRRTEAARRATLHLQPKPGQDAFLLAAMINVILSEGLHDHEFVARHTLGLEGLSAAVRRFDVRTVAARAGVRATDLLEAARRFGATRRGYVSVGTGPNMSGEGTLVEYLALCLDTLCGHVVREGEVVRNAPTLLPAGNYRAQFDPPVPAYDLAPFLSASGLATSAAGPPVAGLPAQILNAGDRQIRALVSCGGNPASAWPDQRTVVEALESLELLVQIDPWMSNTARLAHYVIAPTMPLEQADCTQVPLDTMSQLSVGYGLADSYANYTEAVVQPPEGSDLVDEWVFFYELARLMDLQLVIRRQPGATIGPIIVDMTHRPNTEELLQLLTRGSRVPLSEVKAQRGSMFPSPACVVEAAEDGWQGRADLANEAMMASLDRLDILASSTDPSDSGLPLRLVPRRVQWVYNSSHHHPRTAGGQLENPAYMNEADAAERCLSPGDRVIVRSALGAVETRVEVDRFLRPGLVSMTHCYGPLPSERSPEAPAGVNLGLLVGLTHLQQFSGQPLMSDVPVEVMPAGSPSRAEESSATGD
jgi:anaerobic selenocysteine-containing dehydrogenase